MENKNDPSLETHPIDLSNIKKEITEKTIETIEHTDLKKIGNNSDDVLKDLFYKSIQQFFDLGFELADKLHLDLLDLVRKEKEKK
jgi:hypothetical protein